MIDNIQRYIKSQTVPQLIFINTTVFIGIFMLYAALFVGFPVYAEDSIQYFNENLTISFLANYNIGTFYHDASDYTTNKPLNVGFGFRYKNISASISFPVPFKNTSFDLEINPYFDKIYYHAYIKYYQDFYVSNTNEKSAVDIISSPDKNGLDITPSADKSGLDIFSSAITVTYVVNHENHSLSSVINLDKKQTVSNGSLLFALGIFFSSIYSTDETMNDYNEKRQNLVYSGPGVGYSYTWVFENDMFLNTSMVIFANMGINTDTKELSFIPQIEPQLVFGQHKKTWSFNVKAANNSEVILKNQIYPDILTLSSFSATVSKRF